MIRRGAWGKGEGDSEGFCFTLSSVGIRYNSYSKCKSCGKTRGEKFVENLTRSYVPCVVDGAHYYMITFYFSRVGLILTSTHDHV